LASTKAASASRLKRCSRVSSLVGERRVKAVEESKAMRSSSLRASTSSEDAEGRAGRRDGEDGAIWLKIGSSASVF
jgi:hypothetical protein